MFENATKSQKIKLFGSFATTALLGIIVTLVVMMYLNNSLGWFANNRQVDGSGMNVTVEAMDAEAEYFAYIYDAKEARVHYTGDPELTYEKEPRIDNLDMQFHDTIFAQRNRYTPAVIRIRLTHIKEDSLDGGTINVEIGRDTSIAKYGTTVGGQKIMNDYFSSIMRYTIAQNKTWYDETNEHADEPDELYKNLDEDLYTTVKDLSTKTGTSTVFTTVDFDGEENITDITKPDTITLSVDYEDTDIVDGHLDIYLYITYDATLVNIFEHQAGGIETGATAVGNVSTMVNDMISLVVSFEANS